MTPLAGWTFSLRRPYVPKSEPLLPTAAYPREFWELTTALARDGVNQSLMSLLSFGFASTN